MGNRWKLQSRIFVAMGCAAAAAQPIATGSCNPALLYFDQHFQHSWLRCTFKRSQPLIQTKSCADERLHIYSMLTQSPQCRGERAAARSLHANLVNDDGGEVEGALIRYRTFEDNGASGSYQSQCQRQSLRRSAALDNDVDPPPVL